MDIREFIFRFKHIENTCGWDRVLQEIGRKNCVPRTCQEGGKLENLSLNRYLNILPWDHSRVVLPDSRYINANQVHLPDLSKRYIMTQNPLPNTVNDFWQMVWQNDCYGIVMLNRFADESDCCRYIPASYETGSAISLAEFDISLTSVSVKPDFVIRHLSLRHKKSGSEKTVMHAHFKTWPDFGVPKSPDKFLEFYAELIKVGFFQNDTNNVIHCSAGVGRTGTLAAFDTCLATYRKYKDLRKMDIMCVVVRLRNYRMGLVQTPEQLRFCYEALMETVKSKELRDAFDLPLPPGVDQIRCNDENLKNGQVESRSSRRRKISEVSNDSDSDRQLTPDSPVSVKRVDRR